MDHNDGQDDPRRGLAASPDDPLLLIHVLAQFVFCARAGTIEFEKERDDEGEDEEDPRASVNYVPHHELDAIIRDIEQTTRSLLHWLPVPVISLVVTIAAGWWLGWCPAVVGVFLTMGLSKPTFTSLERLRKLKDSYEYALTREAAEPNPSIQTDQDIHWWELNKAGFESQKPPRGLYDEDTRLAGKPWRILYRDGVSIPVFKMKDNDSKPYEIKPKHYARMAAYCYLLERGSGVQSPYGIVLFGTTFKGKALNYTAAWNAFHDGLLMARQVVKEGRQGGSPAQAPSHCCIRCRHGKPVVTKISFSVGANAAPGALNPTVTKTPEYHSDCGDRFAWTPPHEKALQKGLAN